MTTFEEAGPRLVVRHSSRTGYSNFLGACGLILALTVPLLAGSLMFAPDDVRVECVRAEDRCTFSPPDWGWGEKRLTLAEARTLHIEGAGSGAYVYSGGTDRYAQGRHQLSKEAGSKRVAGAFVEAAALVAGFPDGLAPTLRLSYPAGHERAGWIQLIGWGVAAFFLLRFAGFMPRGVEFDVDKEKGTLEAKVIRFVGAKKRTIPLSDVVSVYTWNTTRPMYNALTYVALRLKDGHDIALFDEAAFAAERKEAHELAERLGRFLGVPVVGS